MMDETRLNIGLLDDDADTTRWIRNVLESANYRCHLFTSGTQFRARLEDMRLGMLLLDWELPDTSGPEILGWLRREIGWSFPVLFISVRNSREEIAAMLEAGADDYLPKPLHERELLARVTALARRHGLSGVAQESVRVGSLEIDYYHRAVIDGGRHIRMTAKEFEIAALLLSNLGRTVPRNEILKRVWGYDSMLTSRTIDTHISRLRRKLQLTEDRGWRLMSIYRSGYRLTFESVAAGSLEPGLAGTGATAVAPRPLLRAV